MKWAILFLLAIDECPGSNIEEALIDFEDRCGESMEVEGYPTPACVLAIEVAECGVVPGECTSGQ